VTTPAVITLCRTVLFILQLWTIFCGAGNCRNWSGDLRAVCCQPWSHWLSNDCYRLCCQRYMYRADVWHVWITLGSRHGTSFSVLWSWFDLSKIADVVQLHCRFQPTWAVGLFSALYSASLLAFIAARCLSQNQLNVTYYHSCWAACPSLLFSI